MWIVKKQIVKIPEGTWQDWWRTRHTDIPVPASIPTKCAENLPVAHEHQEQENALEEKVVQESIC